MKLQIIVPKGLYDKNDTGYRLAYLTKSGGVIFTSQLYQCLDTAIEVSKQIVTKSKILVLEFAPSDNIEVVYMS